MFLEKMCWISIRFQALFEVMTSEASYLKSLNILIDNFFESPELSEALDAPDKHSLFSNCVAVRNVSARFVGIASRMAQADFYGITFSFSTLLLNF